MPAALTTAPAPENNWGPRAAESAVRSVMSAVTGWYAGPWDAAALDRASASRSTPTTTRPSARKRSATARPIPLAAPVTTIVRSAPSRARDSVGKETPVDDHFGSGGEAGVVRCEEGDDSGDFADVGAAAHGRLRDHAAFLLVLVHRGADPARADGIDADAVGGQLERGGFGESDQGALAGAVGDVAGGTDDPEDRGDVDDGAAAALGHQGHGGLDAEQRASGVDRERGVPVPGLLLEERGDVDDPRVVDQHVQSPGGRPRMMDGLRPVVGRGDVEVEILHLQSRLLEPVRGGFTFGVENVAGQDVRSFG